MKRTSSVCLLCERLATRHTIRQRPATPKRTATSQQPARRISLRAQLESRGRGVKAARTQEDEEQIPRREPQAAPQWTKRASAKESSDALQDAKQLGTTIMSNRDTVPSDKDVLKAMEACEHAARQLMSYDGSVDNTDPASALLLLSGRRSDHTRRGHHPASLAISMDLLSNLAHKIMLYPTVFITQDILQSYVLTQATLQRPESFPEIFSLYMTKPRPRANTSPIQFTHPNPASHTAAIPEDTAKVGLEAAIRAKDMGLCLEIINTTFRTLAWQRNKTLTRATIPLFSLSLAPIGLYTLASQFALLPSAADPTSMTLVAFGGGLTYLTVVASMGFIALTTANDQMQRVTWAIGTPLRERWVREEERAAMDKVVLGFGFSEAQKSKWGDESGPEWEYLRQWVGERGCVVDKVELMEGME